MYNYNYKKGAHWPFENALVSGNLSLNVQWILRTIVTACLDQILLWNLDLRSMMKFLLNCRIIGVH